METGHAADCEDTALSMLLLIVSGKQVPSRGSYQPPCEVLARHCVQKGPPELKAHHARIPCGQKCISSLSEHTQPKGVAVKPRKGNKNGELPLRDDNEGTSNV